MNKRFAGDSTTGGHSTRHAERTTVSVVGKKMRMQSAATIDFRMLRRAYVERVRAGDVPRHDACDASIDLVRAAHHYGVARRAVCPLCAANELRNVTYLFGPRLPKSGRCITSARSLRTLAARPEQFTAYTVEVCLACQWNHVLEAAPCGGRRSRPRVRRQA